MVYSHTVPIPGAIQSIAITLRFAETIRVPLSTLNTSDKVSGIQEIISQALLLATEWGLNDMLWIGKKFRTFQSFFFRYHCFLSYFRLAQNPGKTSLVLLEPRIFHYR
jgi:hypothetical protein